MLDVLGGFLSTFFWGAGFFRFEKKENISKGKTEYIVFGQNAMILPAIIYNIVQKV